MFKTIKLSRSVCLSASMFITALLLFCLLPLRLSALGSERPPAVDGVDVPIIMYHSVVGDKSLAGDYVITADAFESDIKYLLENGYTPVFCSELIDYVSGRGELPEKPVVLSFDDGSYGCFYYVLPLLEKYRVKAVFSVVGKWSMIAAEQACPTPSGSYMDSENLKSLMYSGYCELANHTWDMHTLDGRRGLLRLKSEDDRSYRQALWGDLTQCGKLLESVGQQPNILAYPYGFHDDESDGLIKQLGYELTLGCEERINHLEKGDYSGLWNMGRFNRAADRDIKEIVEQRR